MIADRILSLLVGRPVLSVLIGGAGLYALGRYLGWWVPVAIVGAAAIDLAVRWPSQWRPW